MRCKLGDLTAVALAIGLALAVPNAVRSNEAASRAVEVQLPEGFLYPNGIARTLDGALFVGLVTSGQVLRRSSTGEWSVFFSGSDEIYAGTSLRLDEDRGVLWGASPDFLPGDEARPHRLFALDSSTGEVLRVLTLPDGGFGNDLALAPDGSVYVTDSRNGRVLRLRPGSEQLDTLVEHPGLAPVNGVGVGGIARAADGRLIVGNFGSGRLYIAEENGAGAMGVRPLFLPRRLENPDGLAFAPDGALLVLEGAVESGDGKLLRVPAPFAPGARSLEVMHTGLSSPVNLTVAPDGRAFVTLSRIRHRLLAGRENDVPESFSVLIVDTVPPQAPGAE